jgi:SSS family solute:Na+ symporter
MTIPEFYELRFGRGVRILGGVILFLTGVLNMGMFLRAGATFLTGLTGMTNPIAVNIVMTILVVIVLLYTVLGGMLSVVVTDYLQFVVLAVGFVVACLFALKGVGWTNLVNTVNTVHGSAGLNPVQKFGWWEIAQNALTVGIVSTAVWPTAVMRAVSTRDAKVVRRLYLWSSIGFMTRWIIPQLLGVCALAYLYNHPLAHCVFFTPTGQIIPEKSLEAMPLMLSQLLPAGVIGLILAGMIAAQMSTDSSYVLCWSSVLVEDVAIPIFRAQGGLTDRARIRLTRITMLFIGAFLLIWSLWYPLKEGLWEYLAVTGAIYFTGAISLLAGGLYWKRASTTGAYLSLLAGSLCILGLRPVREKLGLTHLAGHELNEAMIVMSVTLLSLLLMILGSLLFPNQKLEPTR